MELTVIKTCSLTVNGPGLIDVPKTFHLGMYIAHARPIGNDNNWATIPPMVTEGNRKKKNWFKPGIRIAHAYSKEMI